MKSPTLPRDHAMFRGERYGPRERVSIPRAGLAPDAARLAARPGDFILTHSSGWYCYLVPITTVSGEGGMP